MLNKSISVSGKENIVVRVFVIGYPVCGESVVVLIQDALSATNLYSCVIDSCVHDKHNETLRILDEAKVGKLDILCWTHPHADHSLGMDSIIERYCDERTQFVLPYNVHTLPLDAIEGSDLEKDIMRSIAAYNKKTKASFVSVSANVGRRAEVDVFNLVDYPDVIPVEIHAIAPHSPFLNNKLSQGTTIRENDLSIALHMTIANNGFLFCGDIENPSIRNLHRASLQNPLFVKIPHHASPSASELLDVIDFSGKRTFGCTTGYKNHKLPNPSVLRRYCEKSYKVHFTGFDAGHSCGVVEYTFIPYAVGRAGSVVSLMETACHGNAYEVSLEAI